MIVFGGGYGETFNTGGRYDPEKNTWTSVRTSNTPDGRAGHTAVWTGSEMIVWGGVLNSTFETNSGGRYDPALDTWTPTSAANAPEGRQAYTAVWTGTEMIVWGGWNSNGFRFFVLNSGGQYNPTTDNWTPTTLTNAPAARRWHTAVWTGSEMIVWGGDLESPVTNTGGRYNPDTDTWIATATINAPSPRIDHTAVWTGSDMIVWGGHSSDLTLNTGGRYNPATNSWTATNTIGAATRGGHSAIWTGKEMIVWGGYHTFLSDNFVYTRPINTGARYNPNTDSWTDTTLSNAPEARGAHSVIWTGQEMIVWGGYDSQEDRFLDTGGRYNPITDRWTPTTMVNAPGPAEFPTAVWTGNQMIVWGGFLQFWDGFGQHNELLSIGGQYCAESSSATPHALLGNISTRTNVQTGDNIAIAGFIVSGGSGTSKTFLIRGIGPSLSQYGLNGVLQDPMLELHGNSGGTFAINNNWKDSQRTQILSTGLAPMDDREAAIYVTLAAAGSYTAVMRGNNNRTGIGLIEVYDVGTGGDLNLVNISTRGVVGDGDNVMIGGIIIRAPSGSATAGLKILARGIGPTLAGFGISNPLPDPVLGLYNANGTAIQSNDNWKNTQQADIEITGLAPPDTRESAIVATLAPGKYTAVLSGKNGATGVGLVEVYTVE